MRPQSSKGACTETSLLHAEAGLKHKTKASCKAGMPASCQRRRECDRCSDSVLAAIECTRRTVPHDVPKDYTLKQLKAVEGMGAGEAAGTLATRGFEGHAQAILQDGPQLQYRVQMV